MSKIKFEINDIDNLTITVIFNYIYNKFVR